MLFRTRYGVDRIATMQGHHDCQDAVRLDSNEPLMDGRETQRPIRHAVCPDWTATNHSWTVGRPNVRSGTPSVQTGQQRTTHGKGGSPNGGKGGIKTS